MVAASSERDPEALAESEVNASHDVLLCGGHQIHPAGQSGLSCHDHWQPTRPCSRWDCRRKPRVQASSQVVCRRLLCEVRKRNALLSLQSGRGG